jgi:hypothetical protein
MCGSTDRSDCVAPVQPPSLRWLREGRRSRHDNSYLCPWSPDSGSFGPSAAVAPAECYASMEPWKAVSAENDEPDRRRHLLRPTRKVTLRS